MDEDGEAAPSAATAAAQDSSNYSKKRVLVNDINMAYIEVGEGDPVVLLHGNPTSSFMWRKVIPHCAKLGRVLAPDLVGMGDSDKLPDSGPGSYSVAEQMRYLEGFLDAVGVTENVTLVVHSWGGVLGSSWACGHEGAMKGFALLESPLSPDASDHFPEQMRGAFQMLKSEKGEALVMGEANMMIESALPSGVVRELGAEEHNAYRRPFAQAGESRRPIYSFVSSVPMGGEPADVVKMQADALGWMKTSEMPILFIRGDPGSSMTENECGMIRGLKNVTEVVVKGKHLLTEDSPDEIGAAIAEWYATRVCR